MADLTPLQVVSQKIRDELGMAVADRLFPLDVLLDMVSILAIKTWLNELKLDNDGYTFLYENLDPGPLEMGEAEERYLEAWSRLRNLGQAIQAVQE